MNHQLFEQLNALQGDATLYLKNRQFQTDELDLICFQVLSDYLKEKESKKKNEVYYELLRAWYYTLLQIKQEQIEPNSEEKEEQNSLDDFYSIFQKRTNTLSEEEKITILYRYPWHLRTMLIASTDDYLPEDFIHNVASMGAIEELDFGDISYLSVTSYDQWAIRTIQDDLALQHEEKLTYQLTKNLALIPYTLEHFDTFLRNEKDNIQEQDKHGFNILLFLIEIYQEEEREMTAFQFVLFALSAMCFWHFETTKINATWLIKEGKFKHLKRIREKLRNR